MQATAPVESAVAIQAGRSFAPDIAAAAVYAEIGGDNIRRIMGEELYEVFGLESGSFVLAVGYNSEVAGGLRDLVIVRPAPEMEETVREALNNYIALQVSAFRNYDIRGSYAIASGAVVFNQGEYLVMLMLPDNESARTVLDRYLPG